MYQTDRNKLKQTKKLKVFKVSDFENAMFHENHLVQAATAERKQKVCIHSDKANMIALAKWLPRRAISSVLELISITI